MSRAHTPDPFDFAEIARGFFEECRRVAEWCRREPLAALLTAVLFAGLIYFFGFYRVFQNGAESTAVWAWKAWNAENDLEHGWLILPAALFIVWWHRQELAAAPKRTSLAGLAIAFGGALMFVLAVRTLQGRLAILALPLVAYGAVYFLWGRETAKVILFPCAFLLFMVPLGFLVSRTVGLQTLAAVVAEKLSGLIGIKVQADGVALRALDGSFNFEVSGGCSGIRSLTAMTMLAALYVHFTQREMWKKVTIFGGSLFFALLGNMMRVFSVVVFAKYINPHLAAGLYHDYSGFIFFPIAVGAMIGFSNLLNRDWQSMLSSALAPETARAPAQSAATTEAKPNVSAAPKPGGPISYDY